MAAMASRWATKGGTDLTGLFKIKLRAAGLRVVYKLIYTETEMLIVVVGARADDEVYQLAENVPQKIIYNQGSISARQCAGSEDK